MIPSLAASQANALLSTPGSSSPINIAIMSSADHEKATADHPVVRAIDKLINRLSEWQKSKDGVPQVLQGLYAQLLVRQRSYKNFMIGKHLGRYPEDIVSCIMDILQNLEEQYSQIYEIMGKMRPENSSKMARLFKAVGTSRYEDQIRICKDENSNLQQTYSRTLSLSS